ncbi:MAG: helix-turn-helix transcriptional regulator [Clostridia bacterium]|nr:helix-turn-helix transcriptional regulator [Clostridia bacterium]
MPIVMERLAQAFKRSGLSYSEFEKTTGIPKATLQRYVTGKTEKIPMDAMEIMAKALNVDPAYLMGWRNSPDAPDRIREVTEALQHNPKLGLLFDRGRKMSDSDLDAFLVIAAAILKERDPD